LSTRRDVLGDAAIRHLERLQDKLPPIAYTVIADRFREELGLELNEVFSNIDQHAVASASIASVFRGRLRDGKLVAIKVRRPGIVRQIEADLSLLKLMARMLGYLRPLR